jgi:hypothetical protein
LLPNSPKRRKRERLNKTLVDDVLSAVAVDESATVFRMLGPLSYDDPRPLVWNDLSVEPQFTYVVRTDGPDDLESLMSGFSRSLRNKMRRLPDLDLTIEDERRAGAVRIQADVADRYREQDEMPPASRRYVEDVVDALDDRYRAYVARDPSGSYLGGVIVLYSNDLASFWLGGVRNSYEGVSVNTLVHRRVLADVITDPDLASVTGYDLVGANTEHLCEYKAKFGGDLAPYYLAESSGVGMTAAKTAYRMFSGSLTKS